MARKRATGKGARRWSGKVKTESTYPPAGLFNKSAPTIARTLASRKVSPKGLASGMRMLNFYINRAGRNLSASHRAELNRAKKLLSQRIQTARGQKSREKGNGMFRGERPSGLRGYD
jgi:hypothetical protein